MQYERTYDNPKSPLASFLILEDPLYQTCNLKWLIRDRTGAQTMTTYSITDLNRALGGKALGLSVRATGRTLDIPKSVIGRWFKDPDLYTQKMQFKAVAKAKVKGGASKKDMVKFRRFRKRILENPIGEQRKLRINYSVKTGKYEVDS